MDSTPRTPGLFRFCRALFALLAALSPVAACSGSAATQPLFLPPAAVAPSTTPQPVKQPPPAVGMTEGDLFRLSSMDLGRELDTARDAGATWIRIDIDWAVIEPTRGVQNWRSTDNVVMAARARGLAVLGIITYAPRWAQDSSVRGNTSHGRPSTPALFGTFAGQVAKHYAGQIDAWEIWNEPNLDLFFEPRPDVAYYTELLHASYQALHAVNPGATVVAGSLAPAVDDPGGRSIAPATFVEQMYAAGARSSLDAVSVHPYSFPALPSDGRTAAYNTFQQIPQLHATMQRYGDGAKLLWLTEFGAPTATVPTGAGPVRIDDQLQAAILDDGLRAAAQLGYIGPVFIFCIRDQQTGDPNTLNNFGIVRSDFSPKPSFRAIQQYTGHR